MQSKIIELLNKYRWLGSGPNVTVVDTPGFKDTEDAVFVDELMSVLGDEVCTVFGSEEST